MLCLGVAKNFKFNAEHTAGHGFVSVELHPVGQTSFWAVESREIPKTANESFVIEFIKCNLKDPNAKLIVDFSDKDEAKAKL